jgi:hypothetical protein
MGTVFLKGFSAPELVCNNWLVRHAHDSTSHDSALVIGFGAGRRTGSPPGPSHHPTSTGDPSESRPFLEGSSPGVGVRAGAQAASQTRRCAKSGTETGMSATSLTI